MQRTEKPTLHPKYIDREAKEIVRKLQEGQFTSFLVGGCVRDLLLGIIPKDYDIATEARPGQVKKAIPYSYIIGKRFRLVLVRRGPKQFEVATFRRNITPKDLEGLDPDEPVGDNFFGTPEEDAYRRDFTINSMLYDPSHDTLIDYCQGMDDIHRGVVRIIGDADQRMHEDPIRIMRALRLAHKVRFRLQPELRQSMQENAHLLADAVLPRKREEFLKWLKLRNPAQAFFEAYDLQMLPHTIPSLIPIFEDDAKATIFCHYLRQLPICVNDRDNPLDFFAHLILAYVRAMSLEEKLVYSKKELLETFPIEPLMRDELGMFKSEQGMALRALHTVTLLNDMEKFNRRGHRRREAFLNNEAFPLAMNMARQDRLLSPATYHYWYQEYLKILAQPAPPKPKRRRRPRKPGPPS